jgi:hypothetical protein
MTDAQPTPDELTAENELICEKLLGLKKHCDRPDCRDWYLPDDRRYWNNPSFTTWADAGLILDALREKALVTMTQLRDGVPQRCTIVTAYEPANDGLHKGFGATTPLAIRAAALEYIRSLP